MTEQPSKEAVEELARKRWNARRAEILESGTAAGPGREWDEIEPNPRNGHDVRAATFNAAHRDLEDAAPILRKRWEAEARERVENALLDTGVSNDLGRIDRALDAAFPPASPMPNMSEPGSAETSSRITALDAASPPEFVQLEGKESDHDKAPEEREGEER